MYELATSAKTQDSGQEHFQAAEDSRFKKKIPTDWSCESKDWRSEIWTRAVSELSLTEQEGLRISFALAATNQ